MATQGGEEAVEKEGGEEEAVASSALSFAFSSG